MGRSHGKIPRDRLHPKLRRFSPSVRYVTTGTSRSPEGNRNIRSLLYVEEQGQCFSPLEPLESRSLRLLSHLRIRSR